MTRFSLTKYITLQEVVEHIQREHRNINSFNGVNAWKMLRLSNGSKIPFEELQGVRLRNFSIYDHNTLIIEQQSNTKINEVFFCRIYLFDLIMINIYDFSAEFYTSSGINMFYTERTTDAKVLMLSSFIHNSSDPIRAQWFRDDETEALLDLSDKTEQRTVVLPRSIDFAGDL